MEAELLEKIEYELKKVNINLKAIFLLFSIYAAIVVGLLWGIVRIL